MDIFLNYGDGSVTGMTVSVRDDSKDLPTKEEAEVISQNFREIQKILSLVGADTLSYRYWTKEKVPNNQEHTTYYSLWAFEEDKVYPLQSFNNKARYRVIKRIHRND